LDRLTVVSAVLLPDLTASNPNWSQSYLGGAAVAGSDGGVRAATSVRATMMRYLATYARVRESIQTGQCEFLPGGAQPGIAASGRARSRSRAPYAGS